MKQDDLTRQLNRLLTGLVDQEILKGREFVYDGSKLHADEVADLMTPSVVCIAQDLSVRVGLGDFGCQFEMTAPEAVGFPLVMTYSAEAKRFFEVAPFVTEVFEGEMMDCRLDLARLFESAVRVIKADFSLDRDTNYREIEAQLSEGQWKRM